MSCEVSKYDLCILKQETFRPPIFDFGDVDISTDTFIYAVFKSYGATRKEFPVTVAGNTAYIEDIKMPLGDYFHELIWIQDNEKEVVFQGKLKVTDKGTDCGCTPTAEQNIKVVRNDVTINVAVSERIINNFVWSGSVLHFEVNDNMELVMYETIPTPFDFNLTNGYLTLQF